MQAEIREAVADAQMESSKASPFVALAQLKPVLQPRGLFGVALPAARVGGVANRVSRGLGRNLSASIQSHSPLVQVALKRLS
jgi:hypothetical protein